LVTSDTSWFGQDQTTDGDTIYYNDGYNMELSWDSGFGSFSGWSVSNMADVTTPGWGNQFSAITGVAHTGSVQYGVCYASSWSNNRMFFQFVDEPWWSGMYVTNTTYAYFSMLNGDSFAKKFGEDTSATGVIDGTNGEDWFLLTIYSLGLDSLYTGDSVNFYLADYRFPLDADDYIIDTWEWVDLSSLGQSYGLDFVLTSSDTTGGFGMNTPAYFAADYIDGGFVSISEFEESGLELFPNPSDNKLTIWLEHDALVELYDLSGKRLRSANEKAGNLQWDLSDLDAGMYTIIARYGSSIVSERLIKQ